MINDEPNSLLKILLVDDDSIDRMSVLRALRANNRALYITEASTAQEALQLLQSQPFDAVLLDYQLPDGNGFDILQQLPTMDCEQPAVIMISGYDDESVAEQCILAGAQDFLLKDEVRQRHLLRAVVQARQRAEIIARLRASEEQLRQLAEHDTLTGLHNRHMFDESLHNCLTQAARYQRQCALMMIDLDHFKQVNDTWGHCAGDALLQEVAGRLRAATRDSDCICRIGGDEFAILLPEISHERQPAMLAERLTASLLQPLKYEGIEIPMSASIGLAIYPDDGTTADTLLQNADRAMYRCKQYRSQPRPQDAASLLRSGGTRPF